jgi:hypothetical protein
MITNDATRWGATCWIITPAPDAQQHEVLDEHPIALAGGEHQREAEPGDAKPSTATEPPSSAPRAVPVRVIMGRMA